MKSREETARVEKLVLIHAQEWRLRYTAPVPGSDVEAGYDRGESVFDGSFFVAVDSQQDVVLITVALDPRSSEDVTELTFFLNELKGKLDATFPNAVAFHTGSRAAAKSPPSRHDVGHF